MLLHSKDVNVMEGWEDSRAMEYWGDVPYWFLLQKAKSNTAEERDVHYGHPCSTDSECKDDDAPCIERFL